MATLDLGKIKFVWRGAYSGATAYETDDVVSYQGSSYICILNSTGNVPTNATYWNLLAQGSDLTILNTQGQLLYRGAAGLEVLPPTTSGFILRTNGSGANPSWASASSIVDPASRIAKLRYPACGFGAGGTNGSHVVSQDGRVYYSGAAINLAGVGSTSVTTTGDVNATFNSVPARQATLPRGAKAVSVYDFFDSSFVVDDNGRLYAAGDNTTGKLGLGMVANGATSTSTADVTARSKYCEVVFPTHNYPASGSTNRPKIVQVFSSCQDNTVASGVCFAIDSLGFLWAWGSNTANSVLGIGTGFGAVIHNPVRIPTFMATGTVTLNSGISQPASSGTRRRIKKVTAIGPTSEFFALVEEADVSVGSDSGVWYWGTNSGTTTSGTNVASYISTPIQFGRGALGLTAGEYVVDIIANDSGSTGIAGTLTVLTSTGRMLTGGTNTSGVLGQGGTTNVFGNFVVIPTTNFGASLTWATPPATWTVPAGMTIADFNTEWTPATFQAQFDAVFDKSWAFHGAMRYGKVSNGTWGFWGTQMTTGVGAAGVGDLVAAKYSPVALSFRDSQHEDTADYRTASDAFSSFTLTTGNVTPGFTIKQIEVAASSDGVKSATIVITSNDRVYVAGDNAAGTNGTGDYFVNTGFFRRVRIDSAILQGGQKTIDDARYVGGQGLLAARLPSFQILLSSGEVYAWGQSTVGSSGLSATTPTPARVAYGAETRNAV